MLADILSRIRAADMDVSPHQDDRGTNLCHAGAEKGLGWRDADRFWMGLRLAFPDAALTTHHVMGRDDKLRPPCAALRRPLHRRHAGWARFGAPTGAEVYIMDMTDAEFGPFGNDRPTPRRNQTPNDETAIWNQILLSTGAL